MSAAAATVPGARKRARGLVAPLGLALARARRRPSRWLPAALGLAVAAAFGCAVAGEGEIAGAQGARTVLAAAGPLDSSVLVTWQGTGSSSLNAGGESVMRELGLPTQTRVVLLSPVRLSGILVRPAAIAPLSRWVGAQAAAKLGRCTARSCPVLLASASVPRDSLDAYGVHLRVVGSARLRSPAALGFDPVTAGGPPVLLTGDPRGLNALPGLSGIYRTHTLISLPDLARIPSWDLAGTERRWQRAQAGLSQNQAPYAVTAPFDALDTARTQASAAPRRLLPLGGGALAALSVFLVLAAYSLRRDREADVARLVAAGATAPQRVTFAVFEAAALSALSLLAGAAIGIAAASILASNAELPVGAVLEHSLLTVMGAGALIAGWVAATALISFVLLAPSGRVADALALAAAAALALTIARGGTVSGTIAILLAPLACATAGVVIYRLAASGLTACERLTRRGPPLLRLAIVGLARAPVAPALAIAFLAVSVGLGGFALGYRATLLRGTSDQAANAVPLDALVAAGSNFKTPLQAAPLATWRKLAGGPVLPVRRTYASYLSGGSSVTIPALGVPASGLTLIHGWRQGDGSAALSTLAARLIGAGPIRNPGPAIAPNARRLALSASAIGSGVVVTADLRDADGAVTQVQLGTATDHRRTLSAAIPRGAHELEALELDEPQGVRATNGHQNAENPAASTQSTTRVRLGPLGRSAILSGWRALGAASNPRGDGDSLVVDFSSSGASGIVRPAQPSDSRPVPVLVDPGTAAAAAGGGLLSMTIDGLPVKTKVVGVLRRFPTAGTNGFVIADQVTLASALDASLPGQGRPDELWIATRHPAGLRAALQAAPLNALNASYRQTVQRQLRGDPVTRGVLGTLIGAAAVAAALATIGLLVVLLHAMRDRRAERELEIHGLGPRALARELRIRVLVAVVLGLLAGLVLAAALTGLTVAAVGASATSGPPNPPLVTVTPWGQLAIAAIAGLLVLSALATATVAIAHRSRQPR